MGFPFACYQTWHSILIFTLGYFTLFYPQHNKFKEFDAIDKVMWATALGFPIYLYSVFVFLAVSIAVGSSFIDAIKIWIAIIVAMTVLLLSVFDTKKALNGVSDTLINSQKRIKLIIKLLPVGVVAALAFPAPQQFPYVEMEEFLFSRYSGSHLHLLRYSLHIPPLLQRLRDHL